MKSTFLPVLALLLGSKLLHAAEVLHHDVEFKDEHYVLKLDMRLKGKLEPVYTVLTDYEHLTLLNDSIKSSEILFSVGPVHTVQFVTEGCVLFFCRRIKQVQIVTESDGSKIRSITDPDESDMKYGDARWELTRDGDYTRIHYHADYVPDFWVPPVIGPAIFKSRLLEEAQKTINGVEKRANAKETKAAGN